MVTTMAHGHADRLRSYELLAELAGLTSRVPAERRGHTGSMPEGDTLAKTAARLRPALAGHVLTRFEAPRLRGRRRRRWAPQVERRRGAWQAPARALRRRPDPADAPAHDRVVARVPGAGALAEAGLPGPGGGGHRQRVGGGVLPAPVVETYHRAVAEPEVLAALGPDLCLAGVARADRARRDRGAGGAGSATRRRRSGRRSSTSASPPASATSTSPRPASPAGSTRPRRSARSTTTPAAACGRWPPASSRPTSGRPSGRTHPAGLAVYGRRGHALPPLRHPGPDGPPRRPEPQHLLVPDAASPRSADLREIFTSRR